MPRSFNLGILFFIILAFSLSCEDYDEDIGGDFGDETSDVRAGSCPTFAAPKVTGRVQESAINECSGIASSMVNPGVLWVHNDSGDSARIYALAENGALIAKVTVNNSSARDWEDMATGPGPGGNGAYLYIADFGDNGKSRSNVQIYRVREPSVKASDRNRSLSVSAERMVVNYPDGKKNAETLLVDPLTGELAIVIKGDGTYVYKVGQFATTQRVATRIAQINKSRGGVDTATGGDVSHDGSYIIVRDYTTGGKLWRRPAGGSVWDAFKTSPCNVKFASGGGGEAVTFAADGSGYFTLNEGSKNNVYFSRNTSGPADQCPGDPNKTEPGECGCGVPEGSCDGPQSLYEAEARTASSGCNSATNHAGFTGSGFIDFGGDGTWIEWNNVNVSQAGSYTLTFRYAVGGSPRQSAVIVNGANKGNLGFVNTGSWTSWKTNTKTVALRQGRNTIRVQANTGNGGPNLDSMKVALIGGPARITASGENQPREGKEKAFDGKTDTKWLTFADSAWIQYQFAGGVSKAVNKYSITSANDHPERDPRDWRLKGSNNGSSWTTLDTRTNQSFSARFQKKTYNFNNSNKYKIFRLEIISNLNPSAANSTQLAEIQLLEGDIVDNCPGDPNKTEPGECGCGVPEGSCDGCTNVLLSHETLRAGEHLCSENGRYEFGLSPQGQLAIWEGTKTLWSAGTFGSTVHLVMQGDGNLVVYNAIQPRWDSKTQNNPGATLKLENDGRVVIRLGTRVLWSKGGGGPVDLCPDDPNKTEPGECGCGVPEGSCSDCTNVLLSSETLRAGEHLCSENRKYEFGLTPQGKLAIWEGTKTLWSGGTFGSTVHLVMQGDGNLVVYNAIKPLWDTKTNNNPGATLKLENDGRVVIRRNGVELWSAGGVITPGDGFTFFAVGDSRTYQNVFKTIVGNMVKLDRNAIGIFNSGDLTTDGRSSNWDTHMRMIREGGNGRVRTDMSSFSSSAIRYIGAVGNHDDGTSSWFSNWNKYLPGQKNLGRNSKDGIYFSVKYQNAIFIVLDSVHGSSTQKNWLNSQLVNAESANIRWKFVFFHHPIYPCNDKSPYDRGAEDWAGLFERYNVDIVFVADSHTYERTCPMIMGECDPDGVVYLNTSGAGAPTRSVRKTKSDRAGDDRYSCSEILQASRGDWDHYCHFTVSDNQVVQKCYSHNTTSSPKFTWTLRK